MDILNVVLIIIAVLLVMASIIIANIARTYERKVKTLETDIASIEKRLKKAKENITLIYSEPKISSQLLVVKKQMTNILSAFCNSIQAKNKAFTGIICNDKPLDKDTIQRYIDTYTISMESDIRISKEAIELLNRMDELNLKL